MGRNVKNASAERKGGRKKGDPKSRTSIHLLDELRQRIDNHIKDTSITITDIANDAIKHYFQKHDTEPLLQEHIDLMHKLGEDFVLVHKLTIEQTYRALEHSLDYLMLLETTSEGLLGRIDKTGSLKQKFEVKRLETIFMYSVFLGVSHEEGTIAVDEILDKFRAERAENQRVAVENAKRQHAEILAQEALASAQAAAKPGLLTRIVSKIVK